MTTSPRTKRLHHIASQRQAGLTVVLEDITDPHNAAAVLRSCDAFGVQDVHFIFADQPPFDPHKIGKASSSSANKWLNFHIYHSPTECMNVLKQQQFTIYATVLDDQSTSLYDMTFTETPIALLFGNEHHGLSAEAISLADTRVYIPMRGFVQSLNLSVTASIFLYEVTRQRIQRNALIPLSEDGQHQLVEDFISR